MCLLRRPSFNRSSSPPVPLSTVKRRKRGDPVPPRSAGEAVGSLALWPPLRRRLAGGGTLVLVRFVDRGRVRSSGGGASMAVVPFAGNNFPGAPTPSRRWCPRRRGACGWCLLLVPRSSRSGVPLFLWDRGSRVPFAGRHSDGVDRLFGILFLRFRLPLSGVCFGVGGRPVGFVQELWPEFGVVWQLVLGSVAEACGACRWKIWRCCCWVWRRGLPRHARSTFQIPSIAAGGNWLQPWRLSLPQAMWCSALFFDGVAAKFIWQACVLICSVLQPLAALSLVVSGLYGVSVLRCLYPLLC